MPFTILVQDPATIGKIDATIEEYKWYLGDEIPIPDYAPFGFIADGAELDHIKECFENIPINRYADRMTWFDQWAIFIHDNLTISMKLSMEYKLLKKKSRLGKFKYVNITSELAYELLQRREYEREFDMDRVVVKAFEILAELPPIDWKPILIQYSTDLLLSGSHELMALLMSGKDRYKMRVSFRSDMGLIPSMPGY